MNRLYIDNDMGKMWVNKKNYFVQFHIIGETILLKPEMLKI